MVIPFKTTEYKTIIRSYLQALSPILKLTPKEMDVLSLMLQGYYRMYPNYTESATFLDIFSTQKRKVYHKALQISENSFNNIIVSLKKKGIINPTGNHLSQVLTQWVQKLKDSDKAILTYEFTLENVKANSEAVQV